MTMDWVGLTGRAVVPVAILFAFKLFRRYARPQKREQKEHLDMAELNVCLAATARRVGWALVASIMAVAYFTYRILAAANLDLATSDGSSQFLLRPSNLLWMIFPGFLALATPWELVRFL